MRTAATMRDAGKGGGRGRTTIEVPNVVPFPLRELMARALLQPVLEHCDGGAASRREARVWNRVAARQQGGGAQWSCRGVRRVPSETALVPVLGSPTLKTCAALATRVQCPGVIQR